MTNAHIQTELSTPEGFRSRVVISRPAVAVAQLLLVLAGAGVAYNLFSTFKTMQEIPWANPVLVFLSTEGDNPVSSLWFTLLVWGPIILLPLAILFLLYSRATAEKVKNAAYLDFRANGYVTSQRRIGLAAVNGRGNSTTRVETQLLGHPSVTPEAFEKAYGAITQYVASLDKKALVAVGRSVGAVQTGPLPATQLVPGLPAELLLSAPIGKTEWVVVIPPKAVGGKPQLLGVKP